MIKKRIMTLMAVLALAVGLMLGACGETKSATGGSGSAGTGSKPVATAPATKDGKYIGEKAAIDIALKHAGLKEKEVTKLKAKLDLDDDDDDDDAKPIHYDIEWKHGGMEYEYDIDALTGKILDSDVDVDD